ncbi:FAD:protein FMN transferase [Bryobacterales bacterium F-183]|nr:FAD:protein FMN transferase [Bryobacterales bacterium F-183]
MQEATRIYIPRLAEIPDLPAAGDVFCLGGHTMGTNWQVRVAGVSEGAELLAGIERQLDLVIAQMSTWEPESDVSRVNRGPHGEWHDLAPEFFEVLSCAMRIAAETGSAYDPTVGPAVDLWGFGPHQERRTSPPTEAEIAQVRREVGYQHLELDVAGRRVRRLTRSVTIDLSSIAKGYAVDLVARYLDGCGVGSYLVEIGGELKGRGVKPDGQPWWVEMEGEPRAMVALCDLAIASSGDYLRHFVYNGELYGHTIDPRTCRPVSCGRLPWTVSVLHASCMEADAYATAMMVAGMDVKRDVAARLVYNGQVFETALLAEMGED